MKTKSVGSIISKQIRCDCGNHISIFSNDESGMKETLKQNAWELKDGAWECPSCVRKSNENNH